MVVTLPHRKAGERGALVASATGRWAAPVVPPMAGKVAKTGTRHGAVR